MNTTLRNGRKPSKSFSKEEDNKILNFVQKYGYEQIPELKLPNRTSRQIRERYRLYLDPLVNRKPFSKEEDTNLLNYYKQFGGKWSKISKMMVGRTDVQLKYRYLKLSKRTNKLIFSLAIPMEQIQFGLNFIDSIDQFPFQEILNLVEHHVEEIFEESTINADILLDFDFWEHLNSMQGLWNN
jgi:hypothetical protein